jgi:predicted protein tyrosine phosphatase
VKQIESGSLTIASLAKAHRIKYRKYAGVLTLESPVLFRGRRLRFHRQPHPDHLVLQFDDLDNKHSGFLFPSISDVDQILQFGRKHVSSAILIHCFKGISRSTAAALSVLADRFGAGREAEALERLLELCPQAVPNLAIIRHADQLLGRHQDLIRVVSEWDNARGPCYRARVMLCRA